VGRLPLLFGVFWSPLPEKVEATNGLACRNDPLIMSVLLDTCVEWPALDVAREETVAGNGERLEWLTGAVMAHFTLILARSRTRAARMVTMVVGVRVEWTNGEDCLGRLCVTCKRRKVGR
jgi:hypothetical protein